MSWLLRAWQESAARRELAALADRLGSAGLSLSALAPGLLATVDQHAAAVRDILALSGSHVGPVELAGYARGVQDGSGTSAGWRPEPGDWVTLRLAAVCLLAAAGTVVVNSGDVDPLLFF
ncbi:DUF6401 family natural product biosynthesis protein [Prauserella muralis]|uniref:Uncharacterized protein n=1 Tax=Prauserella muralis TaxID=588067 RepID=A0A2V4AGM5_9PSEU|nr:DUF6401 family natural product biosynthesis protein [Prauserella muralis]PXY19065.1 hypothetical protein BAY60_30080 [Prauserella muralis]TWE28962.1 hypothetical protein FHX69_1631 [Prauserella muralis]